MKLLSFLLVCSVAAQVRIPGPGGVPSSGGGGSGFSLLSNTSCQSSGGANCTTSAINCTGASLITAGISLGSNPGGVTDSSGNTYTDGVSTGGAVRNSIWYVISPVVTSSMTFTSNASGNYPTLNVACWSAGTTPIVDQHNSANTSSPTSTFQPGSVTPTVNNELIISSIAYDISDVSSIDSSFTITNHSAYSNSNSYGGAMAYLVQSTAASVNPTWTMTSNNDINATILSFKTTSGSTPTLVQGPFSTPNDVQSQTLISSTSFANSYLQEALGTTSQVGNTIVAVIVSASGTSNLTLTDDGSTSNTYTRQVSEVAGGRTIAIYSAPVTATSRNVKMTCVSSANCQDNQMVLWEYQNLGTVDVTCAATVTSGTAPACSAMTPTVNGDFLLAAVDVVTFGTTPTGFMSFTAQTGSTPTWTLSHAHGLDWSASQTAIQATAATITPAITVSTAVTRANVVGIAFKAANSGAGPASAPVLLSMQNQNSGNSGSGWGFSNVPTATAQTLQTPCSGNAPFLLIGQLDSATISSVTDNNSNTWAGLTRLDSTGDGFAIQWWHTTNYPATCNGTEAITVTFSTNPSTLIPLWVFFDTKATAGYDSSATCGAGSTPCAINTTCSSTTSCGGATITPSGYPALVLSYQNQDYDTISAVSTGRFLAATEVCPASTTGCAGTGSTGTTYAYAGSGLEQDCGISVVNLAGGSAALTWTVQNTQNQNVGASFSSTISIK